MRKNDCSAYMNNSISTLHVTNLSGVNRCAFAAASTADELDNLGNALVNDQELWIDDQGVIHTEADVSGMSTLDTSNMTKVNNDPFAGIDETLLQGSSEVAPDLNTTAFPDTDSNPLGTNPFMFDEIIWDHTDSVEVTDPAPDLELDAEGYIHDHIEDPEVYDPSPGNDVTDAGQEDTVPVSTAFPTGRQGNLTRVDNKPFAAAPRKPSNPDQWYNKNPNLFRAEVANMRQHYPDAKLGFLKTTGNMYWIVTAKVAEGVKPWTFLLEYDKTHPNNFGYGGSIHVQLLKSPSNEDLDKRARENGRPGIPHRVSGIRDNGEHYVFLCTRRPEDVNDGTTRITSAVQVTGWAADWALHFETGMINKKVWNKWCDDAHFRHLMVS